MFYYLNSGANYTWMLETDLADTRDTDAAALLWNDAYAIAAPALELLSFESLEIDEGSGRETVALVYTLDGEEFSEEGLVVSPPSDPKDERDFVVELASKDIGFDVSGARALPAGTTYAIHGVDVTGAFDAALAPGGSGRVPALGASYPVVVTVPGDVVGPRVFVLKPTSFYAAEPAGQSWSEFAAEVNAGIGES